jgi:hypothetical protein
MQTVPTNQKLRIQVERLNIMLIRQSFQYFYYLVS